MDPLAFARAALERLIRIPSVSPGATQGDAVRAAAALTAELLEAAGMPEVLVVGPDGPNPAVLASRPAREGAPTVLLYAHHDVQPAGPESEWTTPPFSPVERDGRLYGRGAADDKAGVAIHLGALAALDPASPLGVTVLIEGDEEIASPGAERLLAEHGERLRADAIVVADGLLRSPEEPALTTALRGLVDCVVEVKALAAPLHSGDCGGLFPDAGIVLARLLASLHNEQGNVAIAGLSSTPPRLETCPPDAEMAVELGAVDGLRPLGTGSTSRRRWEVPAVSALAIDAPALDGVSNSLIPEARAKISLRIAPGDDASRAMEALTAHLRANNPWNAELRIVPGASAEPFLAEVGGPWAAAMSAAMESAWGRPPVEIGSGGSIPVVALLSELNPEAEILISGVGDPGSREHAPDENIHLGSFLSHCRAEAEFLAAGGALSAAA